MNTVCKEQKTKIMKKSNLDGGTGVGFTGKKISAKLGEIKGELKLTAGEVAKFMYDKNKKELTLPEEIAFEEKLAMNKECEHEWDEISETEYLTITFEECKKCHANKFPTAFKRSARDFKIPENLSAINKQEWEDIKDEWVKSKEFDFDYEFVFEWLQKNYFCPEKKNT